MPHVDAPVGMPSVPDAAMLSLEPQVPALGASGPYRISFGCSLEPAPRKEEPEGR